MATNTISDLRHEVTSRLQEIVACVGVSHDSDLVEELEEIQKHVNLLDSVTRIPEELFNLLSSARSLLQQNEERTSVVRSGTPGRPAYDIRKEQLEMLLRARFSVRSTDKGINTVK